MTGDGRGRLTQPPPPSEPLRGPGSLFEIVSCSAVGNRPRFWCGALAEAKAFVAGAGSVLTVSDLHLEPPEHDEQWAIVRAPVLVGDPLLAHEVTQLLASGQGSAADLFVRSMFEIDRLRDELRAFGVR